MVKRYNYLELLNTWDQEQSGDWHIAAKDWDFVRGSDYDVVCTESEARHQSCLVLMKSVEQHRERIRELEVTLEGPEAHRGRCKHPRLDADLWCPDCDYSGLVSAGRMGQREAFDHALRLLARIEKRRDKSTRTEVRFFLSECRINPPFNIARCVHGISRLDGHCSICDSPTKIDVDIASGL